MHRFTLDSVQLSFGFRKILSDVFIEVHSSEVVALLGRNGVGKSSLLEVFFGSLHAENACVQIDGRTISKKDFGKIIHYLPQHSFTPNCLRITKVFESYNLSMDGFLDDFPEFALWKFQKVGVLSSGEKCLLEVYILILSKAKLVLLDEPFAQLSPIYCERIKNLLLREKKEKGFLIADHKIVYLTELSDRMCVLQQGKIYHFQKKEEAIKCYWTNP